MWLMKVKESQQFQFFASYAIDPFETTDERVPKVNRDSWRFFTNLGISRYIHLLAELPRV